MQRAEQLRSRVGLIARALAAIGLETPAVQAAAEAVRQAQQAQRAAKNVRLDYRDDLAQADRSGSAQAKNRQQDQDRWEGYPDVRAARRDEVGNKMVTAAVRSGDPEIKEALKQEDGLRLAREMLARREAKRQAEIQRQRLNEQRTMAAATLSRRPSSMPAPAFPG